MVCSLCLVQFRKHIRRKRLFLHALTKLCQKIELEVSDLLLGQPKIFGHFLVRLAPQEDQFQTLQLAIVTTFLKTSHQFRNRIGQRFVFQFPSFVLANNRAGPSTFGRKMQRGAGGTLSYREGQGRACLLYTSPSPRDATLSRMPSSA